MTNAEAEALNAATKIVSDVTSQLEAGRYANISPSSKWYAGKLWSIPHYQWK
jgi:hypothetical protein